MFFFTVLSLFFKILRNCFLIFMLRISLTYTLKNTDDLKFWNVRFFTKYKNAWSSHVCWSINSKDHISHVYLRVCFLSIQIFMRPYFWPKMTPFRPSFSDLCGQKMVIFDQKWIFKTENNYLFQSLLTLLGQTADELLSRQIKWVKQLPFFEELQIPDYTTLISNTW